MTMKTGVWEIVENKSGLHIQHKETGTVRAGVLGKTDRSRRVVESLCSRLNEEEEQRNERLAERARLIALDEAEVDFEESAN